MSEMRAPPRATAQDVARMAGVSPSAVSRVFTPGASASARTQEKVRAAASSLGYRPNILARSLITGRTRIIGLVVAYLDNQFYPLALEQLSRALQVEGYHVLVILAPNTPEGIEPVVQELLDYQVEGLITASVAMSNSLTAACEGNDIPVVMFNRGQEDPRLSEVTSDNFDGGRQAAKALVERGATRIAHISGWVGSSTGVDRAKGFEHGLAEAGTAPVAVVDGAYSREVAQEMTRKVFTSAQRPDAVFVGSDHMAFAVMGVLRFELGLRVPEDVQVIGFDNVPMGAWPEFSLSTVAQPLPQMVSVCVSTLMQKIADGPAATARKIKLPCQLILRGSTRPLEGEHA